ncbi:peroxiredoxin family protein [Amantichitinum ursilacus]|uniref:Thiol-disulfide oxidoreductase ResA n=1 Tax=Amantichitinum ursilacus TaxID=857265 RepID=A0A0N0XID2_9NEIS|nr:TlpA disulfide reductase family protein [Amantichitinum ursilacus]KPC52164.1 Thiol-disulfide oxidoreductase ResA [Amantichitinum ursilacus]
MKQHLYWILPLLVLLAVSAWLLFANSSKPAPDVAFTTLKGQTSSVAALKGKVVLVNFWATTCPGCVQEMNNLGALQNRFGNQGYVTLSVAMQYDPPEYLANFMKTQPMPFMVTHDLSGNVSKAFGDVQLTPTSFLIDKNGRIVKQYIGSIDEATVAAEISKII